MNSQVPPEDKVLQKKFFADLKIGVKLVIGFGVLVFLIVANGVFSYYNNARAASSIADTSEVRVPVALSASRAQVYLLRMQSDVRGYLALGEAEYREGYKTSARLFEAELNQLESQRLEADDRDRLKELRATYEQWKPLPEQLFDLRDDQLDREPAYRKLATDGVERAGEVIKALNQLLDEQSRKAPTLENTEVLYDMSKFQGSFLPMLSALRGYVTTRNPVYRFEYETNLDGNKRDWERLLLHQQQGKLSEPQNDFLKQIEKNREAFVEMPTDIFQILDGEEWRVDLYRFKYEALPLAEKMDASLSEMVNSQQTLLSTDLKGGQNLLNFATWLIVVSGVFAFLFGSAMAYASRNLIAEPIGRLTSVAEQIREGALDTQAKVESRDEIGVLASTFNTMTAKLRSTLFQVRKEKKRADDLLEVVIPIGVELSTEKDFNRLLEKMLLEAKSFCRADTGILYMITPKEELDFVIARSDSLNLALGGATGAKLNYAALPLKVNGEQNQANMMTRAALTGETVNLSEFTAGGRDLWGEDERNQIWRDYSVKSMLAIPLKNTDEQVLGVMQLINPQDAETSRVISFDLNLQQMMESFSSLAVAALEAFAREQKLKQEIQQLKIEIDEAKRKKQVSEIVDSDFFKDLTARAKEMRNRQSGPKSV